MQHMLAKRTYLLFRTNKACRLGLILLLAPETCYDTCHDLLHKDLIDTYVCANSRIYRLNHQQSTTPKLRIYSFAPLFLLAAFSLSLNTLLRIFPLGDFGMTSISSTPPFSHLCLALCFSTCFWMSRFTMRSLSSNPTDEDLTMKAFGTSPAASSGIGITATSATAS